MWVHAPLTLLAPLSLDERGGHPHPSRERGFARASPAFLCRSLGLRVPLRFAKGRVPIGDGPPPNPLLKEGE